MDKDLSTEANRLLQMLQSLGQDSPKQTQPRLHGIKCKRTDHRAQHALPLQSPNTSEDPRQ
jgi:hypothetical protein